MAVLAELAETKSRPDRVGLRVEYALNRLRCLRFQGERVLVAGNNLDAWSEALTTQFEKVEVAKKACEQVDESNPKCPLLHADSLFDAIIFDGIGESTLSAGMLTELFRTLRLGGRAYFCLAADAWFRAESDERSQTAIYRAAWRRANDAGLDNVLRRFANRQNIKRFAARSIAPLTLLSTVDAGRELLARVRSLGADRVTQLRSDIRQILRGGEPSRLLTSIGAIQPDEFGAIAVAAGFADFQWAIEGGLGVDWHCEALPSRFPGYIDGQLAVWECLLTRPAPVVPLVDPARHIEAAQQASRHPVYIESSPHPVISNRSTTAFSPAFLELARRQADLFGGIEYLRRLSAKLTDGATTEDEVARRIVRFVQGAIFRDPVSQPMIEDGSIPDAVTSLLCARGRCGHCSSLLSALAQAAGLEARVTQLPRHVTCEMRVNGRWVIADADAFKHGVIPTNRGGSLIGFDDLTENPYQLDRFPATGWYMRPATRYTQAAGGSQVTGYVDALEPNQRGFVSGYYDPSAVGYPPSLPSNLRWTKGSASFRLEWSPSLVRSGRLVEYRVYVSTKSRGWTYDELGDDRPVSAPLDGDVQSGRTTDCFIEGPIPSGSRNLFASVVAVSDRVEKEPDTNFQPSEESVLSLG